MAGRISAAVDTRTSLGTLPRPIAAVCAARCAPSRSHLRRSARAPARAETRRVFLRIATQRSAPAPVSSPPPLNLSAAAPRRRAARQSVGFCPSRGAVCDSLAPRESDWNRIYAVGDTHGDGTARRADLRTLVRLALSRVATTPASCRPRVPFPIGRKASGRVSRSVSFYQG